jgi:hypothetical protein
MLLANRREMTRRSCSGRHLTWALSLRMKLNNENKEWVRNPAMKTNRKKLCCRGERPGCHKVALKAFSNIHDFCTLGKDYD